MLGVSLQEIRTGRGWPRGARFVMIPPRGRPGPTPRQIEVVQSIANGLSMRETADALGIAVDTARTHVEDYRRRVRAVSVGHGIAIGFREGWLA